MYKKLTHRIGISLLFILFGCWVSRATGSIGVSLITYTIEAANSATPGYTITISAQLTNFDSLPFHDTIDFGLRGNQQTLSNAGIFGKPIYSGRYIYLHGYESVPAIFSVTIEQQYFAPGPAVVVVWPLCPVPSVDSVVINFTVRDPSGISSTKEDPFSYIVLNNTILLKNLDAKTNFKQVRIFNLLGEQVFSLQSSYITEIPVPNLPKGIYLCELSAADNTKRVIKFFH